MKVWNNFFCAIIDLIKCLPLIQLTFLFAAGPLRFVKTILRCLVLQLSFLSYCGTVVRFTTETKLQLLMQLFFAFSIIQQIYMTEKS